MGTHGGDDHGEDEICAAYLEQLLAGAAPTPPTIPLATSGWPDWFPRRDAELALQLDRFDFALPVTREGGLLVARPVYT